MGEEVKGAAIVPESLLKKRKRNEEWALAKKEAEQAQKKKNSENRKLIFKRAEQYVKEYSDKEKELVQLKREAKLKGGFYVLPEAKAVHYLYSWVSIEKQWKEFLDYNESIGFIVHDDAIRLERNAKNRYTVM